jgi:Skp family chaperone for outer membrane proteins
MGTPDNESATLTNSQTDANTQAADGSEEQKQTVDWEKRFKDTQAAFTKSRQEIAELKAKLKVTGSTPQLSAEEKDRLEDLKYTDPDAWREELSTLEDNAKRAYQEELAKTTKELTALEQREIIFADFQASHPDIVINDDVIEYDVPRRIKAKLEKGESTFEEFLGEVYEYLKSPKVIGDTNKTIDQPDLTKLGGGDTVASSATQADIVESYKNEIF